MAERLSLAERARIEDVTVDAEWFARFESV